MAIETDETVVDGLPAFRHVLVPGEGARPGQSAVEYFVDRTPGQACERGRWFYGRTESDDPGDYEENRAILDHMMATLRFTEP